MIFCPDIKFNCCTAFDALKFHKGWFHYYKPKINLNYKKAIGIYE